MYVFCQVRVILVYAGTQFEVLGENDLKLSFWVDLVFKVLFWVQKGYDHVWRRQNYKVFPAPLHLVGRNGKNGFWVRKNTVRTRSILYRIKYTPFRSCSLTFRLYFQMPERSPHGPQHCLWRVVSERVGREVGAGVVHSVEGPQVGQPAKQESHISLIKDVVNAKFPRFPSHPVSPAHVKGYHSFVPAKSACIIFVRGLMKM